MFDDMISDIIINKNLNLNIFLVFIRQYCFVVPKNIRINYTNSFIWKIG